MKYITTSRKRLLVILIFGTYYLSLYATRDISSSSLRRSTSLYMSSQAVWYYLSTNKPMPMPPKQCKCKSLWKSLKVPQYQRTVQYATWELQMQIIKSTRVPTNQCRCHHSALGAWSNIVPAVSYRSKDYKYRYNANAYNVIILFFKCKYKYKYNCKWLWI